MEKTRQRSERACSCWCFYLIVDFFFLKKLFYHRLESVFNKIDNFATLFICEVNQFVFIIALTSSLYAIGFTQNTIHG